MPQRTPMQAYQHVLDSIDNGTIDPGIMRGQCQYRGKFDGKTLNCGVGSLFNEAQLDDIEAKGMNHHEVEDLASVIGEDNIVEVTGLSLDQLSVLQEIHDYSENAVELREDVLQLMSELEHK